MGRERTGRVFAQPFDEHSHRSTGRLHSHDAGRRVPQGEKAAPILLGISGLLTLTGSFLLIRRLGGVAARFHIPLHGSGTTFYEMMIIETWASLQPGLFLAVAAGLLALLACLSETRLFRGG